MKINRKKTFLEFSTFMKLLHENDAHFCLIYELGVYWIEIMIYFLLQGFDNHRRRISITSEKFEAKNKIPKIIL